MQKLLLLLLRAFGITFASIRRLLDVWRLGGHLCQGRAWDVLAVFLSRDVQNVHLTACIELGTKSSGRK